jgi:hypothetical protein
LNYVLQQPVVRAQIVNFATGTSRSMINISQQSIQKNIFIATSANQFNEQVLIVERIRQIDLELYTHEQETSKLTKLKSGLMPVPTEETANV